ncbi:hypothetical protein BGZ73_001982 [Actinomortierella ambigua]|nr:hypothetical protein BGZ73_001982 [Actinomortierella ambigua]
MSTANVALAAANAFAADLKTKFSARSFQTHDSDDAFDQLCTLRQTVSAFDYTFKFQRLAL